MHRRHLPASVGNPWQSCEPVPVNASAQTLHHARQLSQISIPPFGEQAQAEVGRLVERLTAAAQAQAEAETARVSAAAKAEQDALRGELDAARKNLDTVRGELDGVHRDLDTTRKERDSASHERDTTRQELDGIRQELQSRTTERDAAETQAAAAEEARRNAESAFQSQAEAAQRDREQREAAERSAIEAQSALDTMRLESVAITERLTAATTARTSLEQDLRRLAAETEAARHAASQAAIDLETAIDEARAIQAAQANELRDQVAGAVSRTLDGLLDTYRKLTVAKTLNDVLERLASGLASDFARVALFNVTEDRLEGTQQFGFTSPPISSVVIPLSSASFVTEAVKSGRIQSGTASALQGKASPFGGTPGFVMVVPIVLRGKSIAVIYADDGGRSMADSRTPEQRVTFAQLLLYIAASRIPRLPTQTAAPAEVARTA